MSLILFITILTSCGLVVDSDRAIKTMEANGWSQIEITDTSRLSPEWMGGCGSDDDAAFKVKGLNPAGTPSNATVCCAAVFKGCTIRH